ncbi:response regulator [Paenibacillus sp. NFR01]|uniref:response regulator n=1 Tax=Paenibacillus sp. NFR01 TaxID=1566279 RepID=UPI0008C37412|nr:response regulator [Paenibacillus sp. NFR01]SEU24348.1 two-component system, response regulator YesN [Paenibacillus sp. NFR01]
MKKLLIVDDEKNIRVGLQKMIEREYPDVYAVMLAGNGAEALEIHNRERADIIITDIRMPVMDGMKLLERLSAFQMQEKPAVIILSGHDDFEYAKNAIRYRVKDYLLKPIRRDELFAILEKIEAERAEQEQTTRDREQEAESVRRELRAGRLRGLLMQREVQPGKELLEELEQTKVPFTLGVVVCHYTDGMRMRPEEIQGVVDRIAGPLEDSFQEVLTDWDGKLVLIGRSKEHFVELAREAEARGLNELLVGYSHEAADAGQLRQSYLEAIWALKYLFLYPQINIMDYASVMEQRLTFPAPEEELRKLLNMLGTGREKEMKQLLAAIFRIDQLKQLDLSYIETAGMLMNERVLDEVFRVHGEASMEVLKLYRAVGNLYNFRHFHEYYRTLEHLLIRVDEYITSVRSVHTEHADMKEALAFIEENYFRPLNMAVVSNHVSLNYSYFSEAFKAYTGESFVTHLKKVRIRHAKRLLLENRGNKLEEIAEAVGFESSKHFARVFKELEGISPGEFRMKSLQ